MSIFSPKTRSIFCILICVISTIICRMLLDLNIVIIIDILIFIPGFILSYILPSRVEIRLSDVLFYVIALCSLFIMLIFNNSYIAFNLSIQDWQKSVENNLGNNCEYGCSIKNRTIYNKNNEEVYKWHGLSYVYEGYIKKTNNITEYKLSLENKCVIKKFNRRYEVINKRCD